MNAKFYSFISDFSGLMLIEVLECINWRALVSLEVAITLVVFAVVPDFVSGCC